MALHIFVDESGDLGWKFDLPYGRGGSSRYLTIAAVSIGDSQGYRLERVIRDLYKAARWNSQVERKWIDASTKSRVHFAKEARKLVERQSGIRYSSIVVDKTRVQKHLRTDPNKLYNYMLKLLLIDEMARHDRICLFPDSRSLKVSSGNALQDYLQTSLWYESGVATQLETVPTDSKHCKELQFADMLAGAIGTCFEFGDGACFEQLRHCTLLKRLFFA